MKGKSLYYLVFAEGFLVLALQIFSAVILGPYWGNTFMFWSIQLFLVMLALSVGYYYTPLIQKKINNAVLSLQNVLISIFFYLLFIFIFSDKILTFLISHILSPVTGIIISLLFFIFIPLLLFGTIPILLITLQKTKNSIGEGQTTGLVFSLSSVSGIIAVLFFSFLALPHWGLSYSLASLLFIFAVIIFLFLKSERNKKFAILFPLIAVLASFILFGNEKNTEKYRTKNGIIKIKEVQSGVLGQLKVIENNSTQTKSLFVNNSLQSKTHLTGRSLYPYVYSLVMYSAGKPKGSNVLIAGMGAGSLVYEYSKLNYLVDVVDIDGRLLGLVERNFLLPDKKINFIESDIRRYIKKPNKKYDVIIFDLSRGESVPTNVYTLESFNECKKNLKNNGILLIHFLSSMSRDGQIALASVKKTLLQAGFQCEVMNQHNKKNIMDGTVDPEKPEGYILMASDKIDLSNVDFLIDSSIVRELIPQKDNLFLKFDESTGYILTDDKPLLDILELQNTIKMRQQNIKALIEINKYAK